MNVASLCQRNLITVRPADELTTAAELMRETLAGSIRNERRIESVLRP